MGDVPARSDACLAWACGTVPGRSNVVASQAVHVLAASTSHAETHAVILPQARGIQRGKRLPTPRSRGRCSRGKRRRMVRYRRRVGAPTPARSGLMKAARQGRAHRCSGALLETRPMKRLAKRAL